MEKQKRIFIVELISLFAVSIIDIVLFVVKVFKLWLFLTVVAIIIGLAILFIYLFKKAINKYKKQNKKEEVKSTGNYNIDLYTILGIPVQYNKDGTIKNIYELLGIDPVYDEEGNRILTVYELLQIMPKFNEQGQEVPSVFAIKNRVGKIAKVDISSRVLTRKLTEEEKERIAIREALTKKLKEAEENNDKPKQEAIKKIISQTKKKKEEQKSDPPPKYKTGKGAGAIKSATVKNYMETKKINTLDISKLGLFNVKSDKKGSNKKEEKKPQAPTSTVKQNKPVANGNKQVNKESLVNSFTVAIMEDEMESR